VRISSASLVLKLPLGWTSMLPALPLKPQERGAPDGGVTGNFPGSPVDLRYSFRLEDNLIASLEIAA